MHVNSVRGGRLVYVAVASAFLLLVLLSALPVYYKSMEAVLVEALGEEDGNIIDTNFKTINVSLQESSIVFQPNPLLTTFRFRLARLSWEGPFGLIGVKPLFTTFKLRVIKLNSIGFDLIGYRLLSTTFRSRMIKFSSVGPFDLVGVKPLFTTFRSAWIRFVGEGLFSVSITVEPKSYVWNGEIIGAGRWYVFRVMVFNLFGRVDSVGIDIVSGNSRLTSISCSGGDCSLSGHLVNSISVISSGSEYIVEVNVSIPWNVSEELLVSASVSSNLFGVTISKDLKLLVINETSVDMDSVSVSPREVAPGDDVRVVARIVYSGTSIPVVGERVRVYFVPSSGVPALAIMSFNGYVEAVTNSSGYIDVVLQAPTQPGNYNLVVEPLHGNPERSPESISLVTVTGVQQPTTTGMQTVTVGEGVLGGIARPFASSIFILGVITGITMLALLIILQRKRKHRGKT